MYELCTKMLIGNGEYYRFKELLRSRLNECGWTDQVQMLTRQAARNSDRSCEHLYEEVVPKARACVPDSVKQELLMEVKKCLLERAGYYDKD